MGFTGRTLIKQPQRGQFGRRSERLDSDQLALGLEDIDADVARTQADHAVPSASVPEPDPKAVSRHPTLPGQVITCAVIFRCREVGRQLHQIAWLRHKTSRL